MKKIGSSAIMEENDKLEARVRELEKRLKMQDRSYVPQDPIPMQKDEFGCWYSPR